MGVGDKAWKALQSEATTSLEGCTKRSRRSQWGNIVWNQRSLTEVRQWLCLAKQRPAWRAVLSEAVVTEDEVLGMYQRGNCLEDSTSSVKYM